MTQKLSVVSPCFNEEQVIESYYQSLKDILARINGLTFEIILVDDGSSDTTPEILKRLAESDPTLKAVVLSRNFGHQVALTAGIDHASGDALIMMDSDLQHPVDLIPEMIEYWSQGHDVVSTIRQDTRDAGLFKTFTSKSFYWLFNKLSTTYLPAGAADFCLLSKNVYSQLQNMRERHRFLRGLVCWMGFNRKIIPYTAAARGAGISKYSLVKMVRLATEAIFSFSAKPLTVAIKVGLFLTFVGFAYLLYILYGYFIKQNLVAGWASLICTLLILNGFQLIFIGLIGEYISKIFEQVKERPIYMVKELIDRSEYD
ncbi:MAG: glycosyltransferase family 2 protein [Planctomycetota bacterium]|jgi:dolichol-phosphate mannosyltransferase